MSLCNDLFHKSSLFSKSFKVFHCSVINVLSPSSAVSLSDSLFIIAPLSSFVNNFFHLFSEIFLRSSARKPSSCISVSIQCLPSHQRQLCYTIMSRIFCQQLFCIYFLIYYFLNTIDVELPAMLPVHSVHRQDESPLFFLLRQDRLSVKYMSQIQVSPLLPLSVLPC